MRPSLRPVVFGLCALAAPALLSACGGMSDTLPTVGELNLPRPKANFYVRSGFDTDPSSYLGRFIPAGVPAGQIDDAHGVRTPCSQHYAIRKVSGGQVKYDEYFTASQEASAGLNLPQLPTVSAELSHETQQVVRVQYTLHEKWIADLEDPAAYARCCAQAVENCSGQIISEFLSGTGKLLYVDGAQRGGSLGAMGTGVSMKDGFQWQQAVEFEQPVFFAFKLAPAQLQAPAERTSNWDTKVPKVSYGEYFVGVSEWLSSEAIARDGALLDARSQAIKYLGERIQQQGSARHSVSAQGVESSVEAQIERASAGVARLMKDEDWKIEEEQGPTGYRYRVKVLAFMGSEQLEQLAQDEVGASEAAAGEEAEQSPNPRAVPSGALPRPRVPTKDVGRDVKKVEVAPKQALPARPKVPGVKRPK